MKKLTLLLMLLIPAALNAETFRLYTADGKYWEGVVEYIGMEDGAIDDANAIPDGYEIFKPSINHWQCVRHALTNYIPETGGVYMISMYELDWQSNPIGEKYACLVVYIDKTNYKTLFIKQKE
jgi:hypothetical protein